MWRDEVNNEINIFNKKYGPFKIRKKTGSF